MNYKLYIRYYTWFWLSWVFGTEFHGWFHLYYVHNRDKEDDIKYWDRISMKPIANNIPPILVYSHQWKHYNGGETYFMLERRVLIATYINLLSSLINALLLSKQVNLNKQIPPLSPHTQLKVTIKKKKERKGA